MDLNLAGQTVIVLGAARGIGRAIATRFSTEGCRVIALDRVSPQPSIANVDTANVDTASFDVADFDGENIVHEMGDVTKLDDLQRVADRYGEIQHVVYSVGISSGRVGFPFWNLRPTDWQHVLEVNLMGAVNAAHVFAPLLSQKRCGTILHLVSVAGQIGSQTDPPYSAAKAALINFTQCAAKDLAPYGVRVNALSPGMVKTDLNQAVWQAAMRSLPEPQRQTYDEWAEAKLRRVAPLARWQSPQECAAMAAFLASDHAQNITGQTINIDGGQVMHS